MILSASVTIALAGAKSAIKKITIDPSGLLADVKPANNILEVK